MKEHRGVWSSARAEAAFRRIEDEVWAERFPEGVDAVDVETTYGPTRAYRWPGAGLPVVLLHGIGGTSLMWAPQVGGFGGHPLVAVDTMGDVGRSRHERAFAGPDDVADWLHEALRALGIDRAHLVGASYGGWLALNQALRRPEDVESVLLVEPAGLAPVHLPAFLRWGVCVLLASLLPRPLRPRAARRLRMPLLADARAMRLLRRGQLSHRFRPEPAPLADDELARISVPVALLVAEHSEIHEAGEVVERAQRHLADVRSRIVPGAGHALPISHPEEVQRAWREAHADGPTSGTSRRARRRSPPAGSGPPGG